MAYTVGTTVYAKDDIAEPATAKRSAKFYAAKGDALLVCIHREGSSKYMVRKVDAASLFCVSEEEISDKPQ